MSKFINVLLFILLVKGAAMTKASVEGRPAQKGTVTTITSPVTKNVKVYRRTNSRSVKNSNGLTRIFTTVTTTVTTTTKRITVIRKITTRPKKSKSRT